MITIYKSPSASSDTATEKVTKDVLERATQMHISDVKKGLDFFAKMMRAAGDHHDFTKLEFINDFFAQYQESVKTGKWPEGSQWWFEKYHLTERHHLNDKAPADVNLVDVFEMLVDCVMAAMARAGSYDPSNEPSAELLKQAYANTRDLLLKELEVKDPPKPKQPEPQPANPSATPQPTTESYHFSWGGNDK